MEKMIRINNNNDSKFFSDDEQKVIDKAMEKDNPKRVTEGVEEEENYHGVELFTE